MTVYLGLDPGSRSGGIARIISRQGAFVSALAQPFPKTPSDIENDIRRLARVNGALFAVIEKVGVIHGQGIRSAATFMEHYGFLQGVLTTLRIPFERVTPKTWQRAMGCLSGGDKNVTKRRAQELWPEITVTHRIADALLLAEYGRRHVRWPGDLPCDTSS